MEVLKRVWNKCKADNVIGIKNEQQFGGIDALFKNDNFLETARILGKRIIGHENGTKYSEELKTRDLTTDVIDWLQSTAGLCVLIKGQCDQKKSPYVYKSCPKIISLEKWLIWSLYKNCLRMWEIWGNWLLPKALKSWTKSDKFAKSGHTVKGPPTKIKTIELVKPCLALPPSARSCPSKFGCGSHPGLQ